MIPNNSLKTPEHQDEPSKIVALLHFIGAAAIAIAGYQLYQYAERVGWIHATLADVTPLSFLAFFIIAMLKTVYFKPFYGLACIALALLCAGLVGV